MVDRPFQIFTKKPTKWFSELIDILPVGIYRTTIEGNIVYCNAALVKLFGFESAGEMKENPVSTLYRDKKIRGEFVKKVTQKGYVEELAIPFKKKDGTPIWGSVTASVVYDDDGVEIYFDGAIKDITWEAEAKELALRFDEMMMKSQDDFIAILDLEGHLLNVNEVGADLMGLPPKELLGRSLADFIVPRYQDLFSIFLSDILNTGRQEGLVTLNDKNGTERHLKFEAILFKTKGKAHHIKAIAVDVTEKLKNEKKRLIKEKLQGVLEMAGGVSHRLNQRLMIINNLLKELLSDSISDDRHYQKIVKIHDQIKKLNELAKKIGAIKQYRAMEYVAGIKIVDIDEAS